MKESLSLVFSSEAQATLPTLSTLCKQNDVINHPIIIDNSRRKLGISKVLKEAFIIQLCF